MTSSSLNRVDFIRRHRRSAAKNSVQTVLFNNTNKRQTIDLNLKSVFQSNTLFILIVINYTLCECMNDVFESKIAVAVASWWEICELKFKKHDWKLMSLNFLILKHITNIKMHEINIALHIHISWFLTDISGFFRFEMNRSSFCRNLFKIVQISPK